jgi:hypothetical protein
VHAHIHVRRGPRRRRAAGRRLLRRPPARIHTAAGHTSYSRSTCTSDQRVGACCAMVHCALHGRAVRASHWAWITEHCVGVAFLGRGQGNQNRSEARPAPSSALRVPCMMMRSCLGKGTVQPGAGPARASRAARDGARTLQQSLPAGRPAVCTVAGVRRGQASY